MDDPVDSHQPKINSIIKVSEGMMNSPKIVRMRFECLEHGELKLVQGIVLHQTGSTYALSTLCRYSRDHSIFTLKNFTNSFFFERFPLFHYENAIISAVLKKYNKEGIGAHFLISPNGKIYQTARLDRICYHVGYIRARCMESHICSKEIDKLYDQLHNKKRMNRNDKADVATWEKISHIEYQKEWDDAKKEWAPPKNPSEIRYPINADSIGIEVVGKAKDGEHYSAPTTQQNIASLWLVKQLLEYFGLKRTQVFSHGKIGSEKKPTEGTLVEF